MEAKDYEYMNMPLKKFPAHIGDQYGLNNKVLNGQMYPEIHRSVCGLPKEEEWQTSTRKKLESAGYFEVPHAPGLWQHIWGPVKFTLVVDDFGVKYVGEDNTNHLVNSLKSEFTISTDWTGGLSCGMIL